MKKKLEKLEDKINEIITASFMVLVSLVQKIIPHILKDKINSIKLILKNEFLKKKEQIKLFLIIWKNKLLEIKDHVMATIDLIQKYPIKEKLQVQIKILKKYLLKTPLKNHILWIFNKFKNANNSFWNKIDKVGKQQLGIAFVAMIMITVSFLSIYDSSHHIYTSELKGRTPASIQKYDDKPEYRMYKKRTATIFKIQVPIYRDKLKGVRNITIDFTVRTSTRFAKQYLEFHTQKLKDYFFTRVEPVISSFPLEEEGKIVLKEKINDELNNFLMQENVEGVVEEVNLIYSMAY